MQPITTGPDRASMLEVVLPEQASHCGSLHGVSALQMLAKAAYICAARHARTPVIMAKADMIEFTRPIAAGAVVDVRSQIVFQGRSSMTVVVTMTPEEPRGADAAASISGRFMMVAVDADGVPVPIPPSEPNHAEEAVS